MILYFAYHAFAGDAGLGRYAEMQMDLEEREQILDDLESEIARLESDIARLTPETADPDYIEALARERLAFVFPDELVMPE